MPLDPHIAPIVELINAAAADAPPISEQSVSDRRERYATLSAMPGTGPDLDHVEDTTMAGVVVRTYANDGAVGIFVFVHGGGYTTGGVDTHDQVCRQLALESRATVVSVDYRLAPEHPFPAGLDDSWSVLRWLDTHRSDFADSDGNPARIVVGGDSAGGNFSAVLALMARDAGLDLAAQLLIYPAVDVEDDSPSMTDNGEGYVLTADTMAWFQKQYQPDAADWRASPIRAESLAGLAPALVITAEFDPLRDQGAAYAAALNAAGTPTTLTNYEGMVHVFFQLGPIVPAGASAVSQVAETAAAALRP